MDTEGIITLIIAAWGAALATYSYFNDKRRKLVVTVDEEDVLPPEYNVLAVRVRVVNASPDTVITLSNCYFVLPDKSKVHLRSEVENPERENKLAFMGSTYFFIACDKFTEILQKRGITAKIKLRAVVEDKLGKQYRSKKFIFDPSFPLYLELVEQRAIEKNARALKEKQQELNQEQSEKPQAPKVKES